MKRPRRRREESIGDAVSKHMQRIREHHKMPDPPKKKAPKELVTRSVAKSVSLSEPCPKCSHKVPWAVIDHVTEGVERRLIRILSCFFCGGEW